MDFDPTVDVFPPTAKRSFEITDHRNEDCPSCVGGASQQTEHYAMGRLRARIGKVLNLDRYATFQSEFSTLIGMWEAAGSPPLGKEK